MSACEYLAFAAWAGVLSGTFLFWSVAFIVFYDAWRKEKQ